jgi:hypothetical protein
VARVDTPHETLLMQLNAVTPADERWLLISAGSLLSCADWSHV